MTNSQPFDQFETEVQAALEDLLQMDIPDWISPHRGAAELYTADVQAFGAWEYVAPYLSRLKWFSRKYEDQASFEGNFKAEIESNAADTKEILNEKSIRERLCPILSRGANDFFDIAKCITPVLVGASIAGSLKYPLNPLMVALGALMIARIGIERFCRDNVQITK
jgi:uncharacterized protein YeaO (DUF488 family)